MLHYYLGSLPDSQNSYPVPEIHFAAWLYLRNLVQANQKWQKLFLIPELSESVPYYRTYIRLVLARVMQVSESRLIL